jgi:hypothetical protein
MAQGGGIHYFFDEALAASHYLRRPTAGELRWIFSAVILIYSFPIFACCRKQIVAPIFGVAIFACSVSALAQEERGDASEETALPTAAEVQEKLRQWVRTQQLISEERADWEAQKQSLADLNELRKREVANLDELIAAAGSRLTDAEDRQARLGAEEESLRARRANWEKSIDDLESAVRGLLGKFPQPLRQQLGTTIGRLESGEKVDTALQNRFRDVLAVLIEAKAFDSRLTLDTELRELDGKTIEVEILYLGLATAYYTDRSGNYAGTGKPASEGQGWEWHAQPNLASAIRTTIEIFQKRANPEIVELPMQLSPVK